MGSYNSDIHEESYGTTSNYRDIPDVQCSGLLAGPCLAGLFIHREPHTPKQKQVKAGSKTLSHTLNPADLAQHMESEPGPHWL